MTNVMQKTKCGQNLFDKIFASCFMAVLLGQLTPDTYATSQQTQIYRPKKHLGLFILGMS